MTKRRIPAAAPLFLILVACGSGDGTASGPSVRSARQPIVHGTASDAAQDSVVRLDAQGTFACTATLVAPNMILTARHCVAEIGEGGMCGKFAAPYAADEFSVLVGVDAQETGVKGKTVIVPTSSDACVGDIAFIVLEKSVPNAKVAKVRLTPLVKGEAALTVGYGDDGSFNMKLPPRAQRTDLKVDAIGPTVWSYKLKNQTTVPVELSSDEIATGESTCIGDSGGPLFDAKGEIIAVTSRGIDDECIDRPSVYAAVVAHEALVQKAFAAAGAPSEPVTPPAESPKAEAAPVVATAPAAAPAPATTAASSDGCGVTPRSPVGGVAPAMLAFAMLGLVRRRRASK